jgi:hypothetical protein
MAPLLSDLSRSDASNIAHLRLLAAVVAYRQIAVFQMASVLFERRVVHPVLDTRRAETPSRLHGA